jgi:hypothetical protein
VAFKKIGRPFTPAAQRMRSPKKNMQKKTRDARPLTAEGRTTSGKVIFVLVY